MKFMIFSKALVTIVDIQKHPIHSCASRQMDVIVETEDGQRITVPWAQMPAFMTSSSWQPKPTLHFAFFWHNGYSGMKAYLWHGADPNCNFLEPI